MKKRKTKRAGRKLATVSPSVAAKACHVINAVEAEMAKHPQVTLPVTHRWTPGMYIREIFMPAGTRLTSKIHKTEHPFVVSQGHARVWSEATGWQDIRAPYTGITKPGTRRILKIITDCVWTTFHPTAETDLVKLEAELIEPHDIPTLNEGQKCLGQQ